ncbi:MAG: hypothetical protein AVDCRST_MAG02-1301 [uncultured Rubrobacteraceae bacterium]|uniref:Uncharacterized protein n=1 Tax=uncultured Rubrobacteraceae bacterium TaxID=349277 RepID=A0A6J4QZ59_9ACTN|nr:MAG: hypothetical protein AVDCRST_MAG02-1301 [uncultured Rubrobacteraceae bacterium]
MRHRRTILSGCYSHFGPLAEAPENIRQFVERVARELASDQETDRDP